MKVSVSVLLVLLLMPACGWAAGPTLFDVDLEMTLGGDLDITLGDWRSRTKVTVEEGVEGSATTFANDRVTPLVGIRLTVVSTGDRTSALTLIITDRYGRTTESTLGLRDGQQGTFTGRSAAKREIRATVTRLDKAQPSTDASAGPG
jgi:hypothetical protein